MEKSLQIVIPIGAFAENEKSEIDFGGGFKNKFHGSGWGSVASGHIQLKGVFRHPLIDEGVIEFHDQLIA